WSHCSAVMSPSWARTWPRHSDRTLLRTKVGCPSSKKTTFLVSSLSKYRFPVSLLRAISRRRRGKGMRLNDPLVGKLGCGVLVALAVAIVLQGGGCVAGGHAATSASYALRCTSGKVSRAVGDLARAAARAARAPTPVAFVAQHSIAPWDRLRAMTAIILAAGEGKRMGSTRAKVLHTLCGRPLVTFPLDAAVRAGARRVCVVTGYDEAAVRTTVLAWADGREVQVTFAHQP